MAHQGPMWQQAGSYAAQLDRLLLSSIWPAGGGAGGAPGAVTNTMNISIPPGWLPVPLQAGQGTAVCRWDAPEVVTLSASPANGQQRWDLVVCQVRDHDLDAGGNNDFVFLPVTGTPATSSPAIPATPANAALVALVLVTGGQANLNTATLYDRRPLGHAEAFNGTAYTIPATTFQNLKLDTVEGGAGFDPLFNVYNVPFPGRYLVSAVCTFDRVLSGMLQVNKTGNPARRLQSAISGTPAGNPSIGGAAVVPCAAGDTLALSVYASVAANTLAGAAYTYAQFTYQGP